MRIPEQYGQVSLVFYQSVVSDLDGPNVSELLGFGEFRVSVQYIYLISEFKSPTTSLWHLILVYSPSLSSSI